MKLSKESFLKTEFGSELECTIIAWDQALEKNDRTGANKEVLKTLAWCQAQWDVYQMAIKHFCGVEYHFTRTDEYYGLCTEDESDWLMKVDRKPVKNFQHEATREDVREALQRALWETMKIVLESELFTNAAKREIEDYKFIVSNNIPMMTDSVLGIYERILHEIRE